MITPNNILGALAELVKGKFPGEAVYENLCPQGFTRPCTLIELDGCEGDAGFGTGIVELRPVFTMTTFVPVDEYHHSHLEELHRRQMVLTGLLLPGFIKVQDRAPKIVKLKLASGYECDTVTITFSYTLTRKDFLDMEQHPSMGELHLRQEATTYG